MRLAWGLKSLRHDSPRNNANLPATHGEALLVTFLLLDAWVLDVRMRKLRTGSGDRSIVLCAVIRLGLRCSAAA